MKATQIMPGDGWSVALVRCHFDLGMRLYGDPLVGWALTQDTDDDSFVEGVIVCPGETYTILCERTASETAEDDGGPTLFIGYLRPGQGPDRYHQEAKERYDRWYEREAKDRELLNAGWSLRKKGHFEYWDSPDGREMKRHEALKEFEG